MIALAILAVAVTAALVACVTDLQAIAFSAVVCFVPVAVAAAWPGLRGLIAAYLVLQTLVQVLKRVVFLFGPQPREIYYTLQLLPAVMLVGMLIVSARLAYRSGLPLSAKMLGGFLVLAAAETLAGSSKLPWTVQLSGIYQGLLPMTLFFVGLCLRFDDLAALAKPLLALMTISVVYGVAQFAGGPTVIDRVWAEQTWTYSIHGSKVLSYLLGRDAEFRGFSLHPDPLTWGLFLIAALAVATLARQQRRLPVWMWRAALTLAFVGLFCGMTRTSWIILGALGGSYWILQNGWLSRPVPIFLATILSFGAVLSGGSLLYERLFVGQGLPDATGIIMQRYTTVGTMEARLGAWDLLRDAVESSPWSGSGFVVDFDKTGYTDDPRRAAGLKAHNWLTEIVLYTGIPGAVLFLLFYVHWLRDAMLWARHADWRGRRTAHLIVALGTAFLIGGYLNGLAVFTPELFLILGVQAGQSLGLRRVALRPAPIDDTDPLPLFSSPPPTAQLP